MTRQTSEQSAEQLNNPSVPVVAIGASAGGLEAISELLTNLSPTTGMAYVYIQHLDGPTLDGPTPESNLLDALSRTTAMPVALAQDQMPIQPNHVYVILTRSVQFVAPLINPNDRNELRTGGMLGQPGESLRDLEVIDGRLIFVPRRQTGAPATLTGDLPIDRFFLSLANQQRDGAVAVLLSGTASDGTLGMRAIRAAGGLTFAQDETALFQSMPRSAIIDGVVDRILSPVEIARELEQLSRQLAAFRQAAGANALENTGADHTEQPVQPVAPDEQSDENELIEAGLLVDDDPALVDSAAMLEGAGSSEAYEQAAEEDLRTIIQLLRKAIGADFSHYKRTTIRRRIIRRMLLFRLETLREYANYLRQHPQETQALYDDLLINVTTFFRDSEAMDYLHKVLLPKLVQSKTSREPLRIWVPACSTGQEAYSIAMLLLEVLSDRVATLTIQLFATDLSESAIAKARLGSYTRGEVMDVSPRRLQRFFTKVDDHYRINKVVRDLCVFAPHNLLKDPPFSRLDFVSCRNLLIYLDAQLQRKVIGTFHYALNPNGYLLLGKSETVGTSSSFFSPTETNHKVYARKNDRSAVAVLGRTLFEMNPRSGLSRTRPGNELPNDQFSQERTDSSSEARSDLERIGSSETNDTSRKRKLSFAANDLDTVVNTLLLNQFVPASVVVNMDLDILQFRGSTGLFLEPSPGRASLNLLKMARPALAFELRNIIHKAGHSGQSARRSGLEVRMKSQVHYVAIEAVPFSTDADERLFLVLFQEVTTIITADGDAADARNRRIKQLEDELATLRDDMRSVIEEQEAAHEELQSANEEVISSNEELQSINEELETSKEEIESTNEELLTINQELQVRNDQLSESYAFAEAIFGTIREATLVLTPDLRIKSANPVFYTLFGLTESETEGRLIYELANRQWDIPELRSLLTDVATRDVQVQDFELTYQFPNVGEKVLSLNARRVVRQQEAILLAIEDITEHRRSQRLLEEREAWFRQIANNAPTLIWVADPDGRYTFVNKVWLEYTGQSQTDVLASGWAQALHPKDRAMYQQLCHTHFEEQKPFHTEYRLRRHDGDYRWMLENAQPTFALDGQFTGFIGTAADVQAQKELTTELDRLVTERTTELSTLNDQLQSVLNGVPASITLLEAILPDDQAAEGNAGTPVDFMISAFNQQAQELVGDTSAALQTKLLLDARSDFRKDDLFDAYVAVYKTGRSAYREVNIDIENRPHCFAFHITQQVDRRGVVVTTLDITNSKAAEKQIQMTTEALQAVLDNSPASIGLLKAIRTPVGTITDFQVAVANQRFAQLIDKPLNQLTQLRVDQLAPALWHKDTLPNLAHVVETGEPFYIEQLNPAFGWIALSVSKQDDGVVIMGLDVTDLKQMQQQQEELLGQVNQSAETVGQLASLQQQVRARGELLRTSSHDLRGSLGIIQGAAGLFMFADSDEERAQMLEMLQRNVQEMTRLITELLDFSRLESGQQQVQLGSFDAADLLKKLGENVRPLVEGKGLHLNLSGKKPLAVEGDSLNVLRIAQNLVLNALKYTAQGSISVSWGKNGSDEWFFCVEDTGMGMKQTLARQLSHKTPETGVDSDPSSGTSDTTKIVVSDVPLLGSAPGEGIGLVIVRQLCTLLRGRLLVESKPGKGSNFRVVLPRRY